MKYKGKKGILKGVNINKSRIAHLLLAGALVLSVPVVTNLDEAMYEKSMQEDKDDASYGAYREQLNMEEELPELPYVNDSGIEITKEQYDKLQISKALKKAKEKSTNDDWER